MTEIVENKMKYLGFANGWDAVINYPTYKDMVNRTNGVVEKPNTTPPEYTACVSLGHKHTAQIKGRCWYVYSCPICGIEWEVDSSD